MTIRIVLKVTKFWIKTLLPNRQINRSKVKEKSPINEIEMKIEFDVKKTAQDYYGAIINTREQTYGRANSQQIEKFSQLAKNPSFQASLNVISNCIFGFKLKMISMTS